MIQPNDISTEQKRYIRELQQALRIIQQEQQGFSNVPADGFFGTDTENAVLKFQEENNLPVTGKVDRVTWDAIFAEADLIRMKQTPPVSVYAFRLDQKPLDLGCQGDCCYILQIMLQSLTGRFANLPPIDTPDGIYSANTARSVQEMQKRSGLPENGITDKDTWNAITELYNRF